MHWIVLKIIKTIGEMAYLFWEIDMVTMSLAAASLASREDWVLK